MSLSKLLRNLGEEGCYPCVSLRGPGCWRAYINMTGDYWGEDTTPKRALAKAITRWEKEGRPMDGYAAGKDMGAN